MARGHKYELELEFIGFQDVLQQALGDELSSSCVVLEDK
jgi:hypothetical protein